MTDFDYRKANLELKMVALETAAGGPGAASRQANVDYRTWWRWRKQKRISNAGLLLIEHLYASLPPASGPEGLVVPDTAPTEAN